MNALHQLHQHPEPDRTLELLGNLTDSARGPAGLLALHEQLLFYKAYPRSLAIRKFCEQELGRFAGRMRALPEEEREQLMQTGIAGTNIYYPHDLAMAQWWLTQVGDRIDVDWDAYGEREDDPLGDYMPLLAEPAEGDAIDSPEFDLHEYIEATRGRSCKVSLKWLTNALSRCFADPPRQQIYNAMNLMLKIELSEQGPSRTLSDDGPPSRIFLWDPEKARAKFDLLTEIQRPLKLPPPLPVARGRELIALAYSALLPRLRELYPATRANEAEVYDVAMDRGIRMILWFMVPPFRLPLEAGWGLLILKNNVPIGYGAGGMLADRSEIAINVFDTFRGGEAAWLYSQLARMLNSICHAPWLMTRKYQVGFENDEGLDSGSFWFYDKLGFRSVNPEIRKMADEERAKIVKQKGYRTPRRILKKLSQADVVLSLKGEPAENYQEYPLGKAGLAASRVIAADFEGNRDDLTNRILHLMKQRFGVSYPGWSAAEKARFAQMALFVLSLPDIDRWPTQDKITLFDFCRLKGSPREADFAHAFRKNRKFFERLKKVTHRQAPS